MGLMPPSLLGGLNPEFQPNVPHSFFSQMPQGCFHTTRASLLLDTLQNAPIFSELQLITHYRNLIIISLGTGQNQDSSKVQNRLKQASYMSRCWFYNKHVMSWLFSFLWWPIHLYSNAPATQHSPSHAAPTIPPHILGPTMLHSLAIPRLARISHVGCLAYGSLCQEYSFLDYPVLQNLAHTALSHSPGMSRLLSTLSFLHKLSPRVQQYC